MGIDPARADAELEGAPAVSQLQEEVDDRFDNCRIEHLGLVLVVPLGHVLSEVVFGH